MSTPDSVTLVSPRGVTVQVHPDQLADLGAGFVTPAEAEAKAKATKSPRAKASASKPDPSGLID